MGTYFLVNFQPVSIYVTIFGNNNTQINTNITENINKG